MKNIKRILAVVLALTMALGAFASVSAARDAAWYNEAVDYVEAVGIADIGTKAEAKLNKAEFALMLAKVDSGVTGTSLWNQYVFPEDSRYSFTDVTKENTDVTHRAAVCYCAQIGLLIGNGDGTFGVGDNLTLAMFSAAVTRLMGYTGKVVGSSEDWENNFYRVANNYCKAFDRTFVANTKTVDPNYELSYGEVAYLLATILNWGEVFTDNDDARCLTSDGENLGEKFPSGEVINRATTLNAFVTGLEFVTPTWNYFGWQYAVQTGWPADKTFTQYTTNVVTFNEYSEVTFCVIGESGEFIIYGRMLTSEFQGLVRESFGLKASVDRANEEHFNLGDYVNNGSYVRLKTDDAGEIVSLEVLAAYDETKDTGARVVSDTYIVATTTTAKAEYDVDGSIKTYGRAPRLANATGSSNDFTPVLPVAYTSATYTDAAGNTLYSKAITISGSGTSRTLAFKGASDEVVKYSIEQSRTLGDTDIAVYYAYGKYACEQAYADYLTAYRAWTVAADEDKAAAADVLADAKAAYDYWYSNRFYIVGPLSDDQVDSMIPNTAEGEVSVEFSDIDGDGFYDIAVIEEYNWFAYTDVVNANPRDKDPVREYEDKGKALGGLIIDKTYSRVTSACSTDVWAIEEAKARTGKVTLLVAASNKRFIAQEQPYMSADINNQLPYYAAVELWDLTTAYIESVQKTPVTISGKAYFEAVLVNVADGTKNTVYIPAPDAYYVYVQTTKTADLEVELKTDGEKVYVTGVKEDVYDQDGVKTGERVVVLGGAAYEALDAAAKEALYAYSRDGEKTVDLAVKTGATFNSTSKAYADLDDNYKATLTALEGFVKVPVYTLEYVEGTSDYANALSAGKTLEDSGKTVEVYVMVDASGNEYNVGSALYDALDATTKAALTYKKDANGAVAKVTLKVYDLTPGIIEGSAEYVALSNAQKAALVDTGKTVEAVAYVDNNEYTVDTAAYLALTDAVRALMVNALDAEGNSKVDTVAVLKDAADETKTFNKGSKLYDDAIAAGKTLVPAVDAKATFTITSAVKGTKAVATLEVFVYNPKGYTPGTTEYDSLEEYVPGFYTYTKLSDAKKAALVNKMVNGVKKTITRDLLTVDGVEYVKDSYAWSQLSTEKLKNLLPVYAEEYVVGSDEYLALTTDQRDALVDVKTYEYSQVETGNWVPSADAVLFNNFQDSYVDGSEAYNALTPEQKAVLVKETVDGAIVTTGKPVEQFTNIAKRQTVNVSFAGASTKVSLASTAWVPFLTDYIYDNDEGINSVTNPADTAAWMVSKVVKYTTAGSVIAGTNETTAKIVTIMLDTTSTSNPRGFIIDVEKTETGDNTYNVTIAQSGDINDPTWVSAVDTYWTYTRFGGWHTMNWQQSASPDPRSYVPGVTETPRQQMTTMGWTDVDAWAESVWATGASYNTTGNIWAYARNIVTAAGYNASVFDMTLAEIAAAYPSVAGNVASLVTNYKNINAAATDALKFGAVLDAIPGFDKTIFLANVADNKHNVRTNTKYGYWVCQLANIICGGYINTSKMIMGNDAPAKGYFTSLISLKGAASVKTYEVRANASALWSYDEYAMYYQIFKGTTIQTTPESTDKVTGKDLIYVSIINDGAAEYVVDYISYDEGKVAGGVYAPSTTGWTWFYTSDNSAFASDWQAKGSMTYYKDIRNEASYWNQYSSAIILEDVDTKAITVPGVTTQTVKAAFNPYYLKTPFDTMQKFERYWTTVSTYEVTITSSYKMTEPYTTYIPVVDEVGTQIVVADKETAKLWEAKKEDSNGVKVTYKVIDKLLYKVNTEVSSFVVDANGKPILVHSVDYDNWEWIADVGTDVKIIVNDTVDQRPDMLECTELTSKDEGYFPGAYSVKFDGKTYVAADNTKIVVMEPNFKTGNLDGTVTTLANLINTETNIFASYHQIAYLGESLNMLSVIGEITGSGAVTEDTEIVFLGKSGVTIEVVELGNYFVVKSTYSAVKLPTCEEFGTIQKTYSTYAEAKYAATVNLVIDTGYYVVKPNGEIVGTLSDNAKKTASIKKIDAQGNMEIEVGGKTVNATSFKWAFLYEDFDGNLYLGGDSKTVSMVPYATALNAISAPAATYAKDAANYQKTLAWNSSSATKAKYKGIMEESAAALEAAKAAAVKTYFDGQFWGCTNSPAYNYVSSYTYTYQQKPDAMTFDYIVIDGVYCVLVSTFFN